MTSQGFGSGPCLSPLAGALQFGTQRIPNSWLFGILKLLGCGCVVAGSYWVILRCDHHPMSYFQPFIVSIFTWLYHSCIGKSACYPINPILYFPCCPGTVTVTTRQGHKMSTRKIEKIHLVLHCNTSATKGHTHSFGLNYACQRWKLAICVLKYVCYECPCIRLLLDAASFLSNTCTEIKCSMHIQMPNMCTTNGNMIARHAVRGNISS